MGWVVIGLGLLATAVVLLNAEYRHNFLTGSGVAQGALIAAVALGVMLTYRGSGVVNFANGAIAMYVAYVYSVLRRDGDLFLPPLPNPLSLVEGVVHWFQPDNSFHLPDIPTKISFATSLSFWPALTISLAFCVALGLVMHFLIFRPLRFAPPIAKVVASVGLFLLLEATVIRRFGTTPIAVRPIPFLKKTTHMNLGVIKLNQEQFFVGMLVIVFAALLWLLFQKTRFGLATRAAAENEKGAVVLGFNPDFLAGTNWVLSTVITGLLAIFVATSLSTIEPTVLPALIVPALTAALVGGFTSFPRTTIAAFVLGMQKPLIAYLGVNKSWFPKSGTQAFPGVDRVLPLVVIVLVLYLAGNALPARGSITAGRLPFSPTPPAWAIRFGGPALALLAAGLGLFVFGPAYRGALSNTLVGIIICLSVVVITGFVGQISLAQMAFAGISAFIVSHLSSEHGWPFPVPILAGAIVALVIGLIVALPALRVRGVNLAIVTFAFAVAVDDMIFKNNSVNGGFKQALVKAPSWVDPNQPKQRKFFGLIAGDGKLPNPTTAIFCLVITVVLCYLVANLRRSTTGRQMLAMRSNERAAAAAGVNVSATKLLAFGTSAFIAGIGGAVIAYRSGNATPDKFDYTQSLVIFAFAYLGGISSVGGAIAGGFLVAGGLVFTFLQRALGIPPEFTLLLGGIGLVITAILNPEGVAGRLRLDGLRLKARFQGSRSSPNPPAADAPLVDQGAA
ncbi:MAG TPA: ABC transporter permease [Acidimicrobiia bacterium]|nr:ABC transporter permease [Acidimicrobiia bacterium]